MTDTPTKTISIKPVGTNRSAETVSIEPGATVTDVLKSIGLGATGYHLTDPNDPDAVFNGSDNLYSRVNDGDLLAAVAAVDAGREVAA